MFLDPDAPYAPPRYFQTLHDGFFRLEEWLVHGSTYLHLVLRTSDSVAGGVIDWGGRRFLLIDEPQPAMVSEDNPSGSMKTLVAGRFDRSATPREGFAAEAREKAGITIDPSQVGLLNHGQPMALSSDVLTEKSHIAVANITDASQITSTDDGVRGIHGERIRRFWISFDDLNTFICDDVRVMLIVQHIQLELARQEIERQRALLDSFTGANQRNRTDYDSDELDDEEHR